MASYDALDNRVRELNNDRYKEYQQDVLRRKALADRAAKIQKERVKRRRGRQGNPFAGGGTQSVFGGIPAKDCRSGSAKRSDIQRCRGS